jgi:hypothetical protein
MTGASKVNRRPTCSYVYYPHAKALPRTNRQSGQEILFHTKEADLCFARFGLRISLFLTELRVK